MFLKTFVQLMKLFILPAVKLAKDMDHLQKILNGMQLTKSFCLTNCKEN